jgi:aryl-alcohol dehydrogenase-like predicted oxidoreductase
MSCRLSRRQFLSATAGLPLGASLAMGASPTDTAEPKSVIREFRRGGMVYRRLGRTDLDISALGFGSHTDPGFKVKLEARRGTVLSAEGQAQRDRQIARALDLGVNILDVYENQGQREPVARIVRPRRDKVLVSCCRQLPRSAVFIGDSIDEAAKLYGHVDLFRLVLDGRDPLFKEKGSEFRSEVLEEWDVLRRAKEVGKVRAIGIAAHFEVVMNAALEQLEGLDFVLFPYNFIHARAEYSDFLQRATREGIGLIAIKGLAGGSISQLDARGRPSRPENARVQLYQSRYRTILPAALAELTKTLDRLPDETLCQAALRFVYSQPLIAFALTGIFQDQDLDENYAAVTHHVNLSREEMAVLDKASHFAKLYGPGWVPPQYRWLEGQWRA